MKYVKFTYVDSVTGLSVAVEPAMNGTKFPAVDGLVYVWARESEYPTDVPEFFGTCPDGSNTELPGVLGVYSAGDWQQMQTDELRARIPQSVEMRQFRRALRSMNLLATVNSKLTALLGTEGEDTRIEWEFSSDVKRTQPWLLSLGLTSLQLDALFITAAKL